MSTPHERFDLGDGAWLEWWPRFLAPAETPPLEALVSEIPLRSDRFQIFGRSVAVPRLVAWLGDPGCRYRYSGQTYEPQPWPPRVAHLRDTLRQRTGLAWNGALANYYRDGADAQGWHSDDERELGPDPPHDVAIASLSLGAERRFRMRRRDRSERRDWVLPHASLLLMRGATQRYWQHCLPRTRQPVGPRLNLTFRVVIPARG